MDDPNRQTLKNLRRKWGWITASGVILWWSFFAWLRTWWQSPNPWRWLLMSGLALGYLLGVLWHGLDKNRRPHQADLLPTLGLGNLISIGRGFIIAFFCGFLFSPWPDSAWKAWLPGILYTLATLPDFVDGIAARLTDHVTKLGEILDMSTDSLGMLGVSLLAVQYGQVPGWYLLVGLARYIFLAGIWLRHRRNLPVYDLPFSVRRRGYGALAMGLFLISLYPLFQPPGTYFAAMVFAAYVLGGFVWDWLVTIGWLPAQPGEGYLHLERIILRYVPLGLRLLLLLWGLTDLVPELLSGNRSPYLWLEAGVALCLVFGIAGRVMAIAALVILGLHQSAYFGLIFLNANLLFLGTGVCSLLPIEDRLIYHRVGDHRQDNLR